MKSSSIYYGLKKLDTLKIVEANIAKTVVTKVCQAHKKQKGGAHSESDYDTSSEDEYVFQV